MTRNGNTHRVLAVLTLVFSGLAVAFALRLWGRPVVLPPIPLVDPIFTNTATARVSLGLLLQTHGDTSDYDCYTCHDKKEPVKLKMDGQGNVVLPKEHSDLVMGHGSHNRNNNCYNCHDESNLEVLQTRDGRHPKLAESSPLCGSCHGPTYDDWEAGAHGRISGYWDRKLGPFVRQNCVACHDPHKPAFPPRAPAPGPHLLHPIAQAAPPQERNP